MNKYVITSDKTTGEVVFTYNDKGLLIGFDFQLDDSESYMLLWTLNKLIFKWEEEFKNEVKSLKIRCTKLTLEVTFDMFWEKYDHKSMSSKHKTLARWKNLSKTDQIRAFNFISTYNSRRMSMVPCPAKKLAETYLNSMMWNN
jgi:hypothetical protein